MPLWPVLWKNVQVTIYFIKITLTNARIKPRGGNFEPSHRESRGKAELWANLSRWRLGVKHGALGGNPSASSAAKPLHGFVLTA